MSTILKALRRLEREKAPTDRPLREQVTGPGGAYRGDSRPQRRWPILLGGVGAGVVAGLALLLLVLSRDHSAERPPPEASAAGDSAAAPSPPRPITPAAPPAAPVPGSAAEAKLDEVAVVERVAPGPRIVAETEPIARVDPTAPLPGSVRPMQRPDPGAFPGQHLLAEATPPSAPEAPAPAPPPVPRAEPVAPAREPAPEPTTAPAPRASAPAPPKAAAPRADPPKAAPVRAARAPTPPAFAFPTLRVERTTWHPIAERRVAVIALPGGGTQSVHEGELVAGARVKRIEPSAVVFEHAGREIRRKVGAGS